jgi:Holliday junction DNA helicase RuvB
VQLLLANLGIIAHRCSKTVRGQTYWQLFIGGRDAVVFRERVGFRLSRKQERLAGLEHLRRGANRSDLVPYAHVALAQLLDASRPHTRALHKRFYHVKRGDRLLSRPQVETYRNLLPESARTHPAAGTLEVLCDSRYYWDRVASLQPGQAEVFDFCVPGGHSFVANGFFNHNTTLAHVLSAEMGVGLKVTAGPAIERAGDLAAILTNLRQGDILFIDEVHRLGRAVEEVLYPAMEDFALDIVIGKGPSARNIRLKLPRFTLIGATTRLALMTAPLRARFGAVYRFDFYDVEAMQKIVRRAAGLLQVPITGDGVNEIARRGRGTPRVALRLLRRVRDYAQVKASGTITPEVAREALALMEVDELGLDTLDRQVLGRLIRDFRGGPVGLETIAAALSEEPDTIMDVVEPYLMQLGFLERTPRGRVATHRAYEHLGEPYPEIVEQPGLFNQAVQTSEN